MAMLYELLPLVLFLAALVWKGIYVAVIVLMIAMPIALVIKTLQHRKLDRMQFWSTLLALVFGGLTLYFHDERFIFWKPTIFYWAMAAACLLTQWLSDKSLVQRFFGMVGELDTARLSTTQWARLNYSWVVFFLAIGILNLYVAFNFSITVWGAFKLVLVGLSFVFILGQTFWIVQKLGPDALTSREEQSE